MSCALDHLVVAAATLDEGVAWCAATLGVVPGPGGRHALFGTHNRLLRLAGPDFPRAYLEIIAVDPGAPPPARPRWFGLDDPALQAGLRDQGPRLLHAVLRTSDLPGLRRGLVDVGHDPGVPLAAERDTPAGPLRWQILVRDDGALPGQGALPTLIQWDGRHPTDAMPASPVVLQALHFGRLPARAAGVLGLGGVTSADGDGPALRATLATPRGVVTLHGAD